MRRDEVFDFEDQTIMHGHDGWESLVFLHDWGLVFRFLASHSELGSAWQAEAEVNEDTSSEFPLFSFRRKCAMLRYACAVLCFVFVVFYLYTHFIFVDEMNMFFAIPFCDLSPAS